MGESLAIPLGRILQLDSKGSGLFVDNRGHARNGYCFPQKEGRGVPFVAQWSQTQLVPMRTQVQSLASLSGSRICCCCELLCTSQMLPWLWLWPAAAALIRPLAWKLPYALKMCGPKHTHTQKGRMKYLGWHLLRTYNKE